MSNILYTIRRRFEIDAGHRVYGHEGKCASLHGHRYAFQVYFQQVENSLDNLGRVVDFSVAKNKVGAWLENNWDHAMLLWTDDPVSIFWNCDVSSPKDDVILRRAIQELRKGKYFLLPVNPTAENLAGYLLEVTNQLLNETGIVCNKVECWETPNCMAIADTLTA